MRKKIFVLVVFLLLSNEIVLGKHDNSKKNSKGIQEKNYKRSLKVNNGREKRSLDETYIEHDLGNENHKAIAKYSWEEGLRNVDRNTIKEVPFWGTRGRRDSSSESVEYVNSNDESYKDNICKSCSVPDFLSKKIKGRVVSRRDSDESSEYNPFWGNRGRRQDDQPFWGNRGRRGKLKMKSYDTLEELPFWSSRGRRDDAEPFWGNRGRRDEMEPFWGNRGRRDEMEPFWGNRGRRHEMEPFWGNRGKRDEMEPFWGNRGRRDEMEPFWGNRGRRDKMETFGANHGKRDDIEPFWGNRGRRQDIEPFWGSRGRREVEMPFWRKKEHSYWTTDDTNPFWGIRGRRKFALKDSIIKAINNIEYDIENLARIRKNGESSFWGNRGRDSKLEQIFSGPLRNRVPYIAPDDSKSIPTKIAFKTSEPNTMYDNRIYAEEPHYILVERSSRSSAENDPFFISRGKKYMKLKLPEGIRDRRGAIEDLVKSVRNDPYYIARGKKDSGHVKIGNITILKNEFAKAKELICSTIDLLGIKNGGHKVKRDADDSERERRTILKKLAAQLQVDPYFVSRGKKNGSVDVNEGEIEEFVNRVVDMCN